MGASVHTGFQTEIDFELPKGYVDDAGTLHRRGTMRLATAADEILPLRDPRVQQNEAYLVIIVLARVITRLEEADPARLSFGTPMRFALARLHTDDDGAEVVTYTFAPAAGP